MSHAVFLVLIVEVHLLLPWYVSNHLGMGADVYASAEIYYTFGALFAGLAIRSIFRHINEVTAVIRLMILTVLIFLICAFTRDLWVFFVFSILIGLTNAGTRVLRITYLFHHIPNNLMGRANSVFQTINIFLRAVFIGLFSLPFFSKGSNVTWAYLIDGVVVLLSVIPLLIYHRSLREIQYRE